MSSNTIILPDLTNARLSVVYSALDSRSTTNVLHSHIHNECEIYINLSGDVSFIVENRIYPISPGSIIITRPGEYHHCVYHSDAIHRHFWILFSADRMETLFSRFYNRAAGEGNLLTVTGSVFKKLTELCDAMREENGGDELYYRFFKLIHLLNQADVSLPQASEGGSVTERSLDFIRKNMTESISVKDIAEACYVSISTLERCFYLTLRISPSEYMRKIRLAKAAELLQNGASVTYACHQSGFVDCSKFIQLFKKYYGKTPLQWKKLYCQPKS